MPLVIRISFIFFLLINYSFSEIPIIVISPSKTSQSLSSTGSDITLIDSKTISESNENFLGDLFDSEIQASNFSRQGGAGTNTIIQLRGLPKRYTNVYLDGVKLSDPSTPDNAYYFNNLTTGSINSVEVLKGNQSSIYGSSAIGGVINLFSRDGRERNNKFFQINTGSNNTKNITMTYGNNNHKYNYSFTLEKYLTSGISSMSDNAEKDSYKNDNFHAAFGFEISKNTRIESNFKVHDIFLNYDEVTSGRKDGNNTQDQDYASNLKIINKKGNLNNSLILNHYFVRRKVTNYDNSSTNFYYGERKNINYLGEYNLNLDKKIIFGLDNEFNRANYTTWAVTGNKITDDQIFSQFIDFQQRHNQKFYSTIGVRKDLHSKAGSYQTGRIVSVYNYNKLTKYRASAGTGIRFGSLNDYYYDENIQNKENLKPEKSYSIDFGIDKNFEEVDAKLNLTFFYTEYDNNISNWASNTDGGRSSYVINNSGGKIKSKGFDIKIKKKINNKTNINLNYTFTNAYDGEDCDDPNKSSSSCSLSSYPVRIPKNQMFLSLKKILSSYLTSEIKLKYISSRRDYGNINNNFADVIIDSYSKVDLKNDINFYGKKMYFNINNIFNKKYEEAYQYSTMRRSYNLGFKQTF